ncbi:MAG: hypothetical protein R3F60_01925 [bacterium]
MRTTTALLFGLALLASACAEVEIADDGGPQIKAEDSLVAVVGPDAGAGAGG